MNYYFIDGNNLAGKLKGISNIKTGQNQLMREKLISLLSRYYSKDRNQIVVFFDGFPREAIRAGKIKIIYSNRKTADDEIKEAIANHKNPRLITLITSDNNLREYGKACSCRIKSCEELSLDIETADKQDDEKERIEKISNSEIKKLFGI